MIVEYGTGHGSVDNVLQSLRQSVNTYQEDILAYLAACCVDCLQSAKCHSVIVAEYNLDLLAMLAKCIGYKLLCLYLIPVTNLIIKLFYFPACIYKSLYGELGTLLRINVLGVALDHDVLYLAIAV